MSIRFMPKKTTTAGKVPTTSDLIDGELGVNVTDKKLYIRVGAAIIELFKSLTKSDLELENVDNTADANKSVLSASKLTTARSIAITGGATGTATTFDGSANISIPVTGLNASNLNAGTIPVARSWALTGDVTSPAGSAATTLANSGVTAASYGPAANATLTSGGTFTVPQVTFDAKGRATSAATRTMTLPSMAGLASNTFTGMQTIQIGNSTTKNDQFRFHVTDHGVDKADLYITKETAASYWAITLWDSTKITGTLNVNSSWLTHNGRVVVTTNTLLMRIEAMSAATYAALSPKDANTLYVIT